MPDPTALTIASATTAHDAATGPALKVVLLRETAVVPEYHSAGAAGLDLAACTETGGSIDIPPGEIRVVPCGIAVAIPPGHEGQVRPRSGLATRFGISMPNTPGTIDSDYRGEIRVPLVNLGKETFRVEQGMRIAQMVIAPVVRVRVELEAALEPTERGAGGFGSTGR